MYAGTEQAHLISKRQIDEVSGSTKRRCLKRRMYAEEKRYWVGFTVPNWCSEFTAGVVSAVDRSNKIIRKLHFFDVCESIHYTTNTNLWTAPSTTHGCACALRDGATEVPSGRVEWPPHGPNTSEASW